MTTPRPYFIFKYLFILISVLLTSQVYAQDNRIKRLGNNDGLSNSAVTTIYQDLHGLMWFGTWDGLNMYTGSSFENFRPLKNDSLSISNHIIRDLFSTEDGKLWITTDYGINRYDILQHKFKSFYLDFKDKGAFREHSFLTAYHPKGIILASTYDSGIYIYNNDSAEFTPVAFDNVSSQKIVNLFFDTYDALWVIYENKTVKRITFKSLGDKSLSVKECQTVSLGEWETICYDNNDRLWIQHEDYSISHYSISNRKEEKVAFTLSWGKLNAVLPSDAGYLLATGKGLVRLSSSGIVLDVQFPNSSILSLYKCTQDILWMGTDSQGIIQLLPQKNYFHSFSEKEIPELGNYAVRSFFRDINQRLWIGTKGGGLICMDGLGKKESKVKKLTVADGLKSNSILSMAPATYKDFWIGTDSKGLNYYSFKEDKIKSLQGNIRLNTSSLYSIYTVLQSNDSTLWVGTSGNGLFKLHIKQDATGYLVTSHTHFLFTPNTDNDHTINNNIVYSLAFTDKNTLWIATRGGGLNRLDVATNQFTAYKNSRTDDSSLSSNDVLCLHKTAAGELLIGTGMGLNILQENQGNVSFKRYTESDGLSNSTIHGILTDKKGQIWVSTNKGITKIDLAEPSFLNYFYSDGLQDNEFSDGAYLASTNREELYFGGINGFSVFHPSQIGVSEYIPPLFLKSFRIDNVEQPLDLTKKVYVNNEYNFLSFRFEILDYISNDKCQIAYQVCKNGNERNEWIPIGSRRDIVLSNLAPGEYTLQVKYSNGDNHWNTDVFAFHFQITPPWWLSVYAYIGYFLLLCGIVCFLFRIQTYKIHMHHKLELERMDSQKNEDIHQAKLRFFTNIAHEFSNSITLIYGPCEQMIRRNELNEKDYNYLQVIKRNAERMQNQIQQLMEFRKAETGNLTLHFESVDAVELVKYTLDSFADMAAQKKIELKLNVETPISRWVTDRDAFEKIIFNLLSNAFKYTPQEGVISIHLYVENQDKLCFHVTNSGVGIKADEISLLFNRFRVLDNFESKLSKGIYTRNGIGLAMCRNLIELLGGTILVDSKIDEYTTFKAELPQQAIEKVEEVSPSPGMSLIEGKNPLTDETDNFRNKKILIIDDQVEIRMLIKDILEKYQTWEASNGEEALEMIEKSVPDLIICDILMPVMDGITLLKILRDRKESKHIPVILLSSKNSIESQIEGLETGADIFLSKPFHPNHLVAMVDRSLCSYEIAKSYIESPQAYTEQFMGKNTHKEDKEFITKAISLLKKNLDNENYNQDALSNDLAVSRMFFYRKIKAVTNFTPAEFIRNYRLQEAEKLLKATRKTVQEIMIDCGFHNKAYFYREFAKIYQCTPKEYRAKALCQK